MKSLSDDGNGNVKLKRQAENMPRAISFKRVKEREKEKDREKKIWEANAMAKTKISAKICAENSLANIQRSLAPFIIILFMRAYVFYFLSFCLNIVVQNYGAAFYKSKQIKLYILI